MIERFNCLPIFFEPSVLSRFLITFHENFFTNICNNIGEIEDYIYDGEQVGDWGKEVCHIFA